MLRVKLTGVIKGFNVYTKFPTSQRPIILGLYRPVAGVTCKFTLLKYWKPDIAASNTGTKVIFVILLLLV